MHFRFHRVSRSSKALLASHVSCLIGALLPVIHPHRAAAAPANEYLTFVQTTAARLRAEDRSPGTRREWEEEAAQLRRRLTEAWGAFPNRACPLNPRILGVIERDGYRIEKLIFQTFPGVWMTANAYVPAHPRRHPALLAVHGHWRGAKQDPVVQARCIGPARLGYFVLAVDAFGAGERAIGKALGEYHGEMTAATLLPTGLSLAGLQVYENQRAVDYLRSRPEVDRQRIAITGASGGGNQTMYAGAWDRRFKAVIPVCSVGNYQAYLGAACCLCEVVPGALRFTEEGGVLGLTAPRALLVMNATRDARQFSVPEAAQSIAAARPIYDLHGSEGSLQHAIFESGHDYSQAMRERLYGWLARHLRQAPSSDPIPEPALALEPPESLRCFPGESRPDDWLTLPQFAAREAARLVASKDRLLTHRAWEAHRPRLIGNLRSLLHIPEPPPRQPKANPAFDTSGASSPSIIRFSPEPGINLQATYQSGGRPGRTAIVLSLEGQSAALSSPLATHLKEAGWSLVTLDLRATGAQRWPGDQIGAAPDHNTAEWGLWIGRPLLGQWSLDVQSLVDHLLQAAPLAPREICLAGIGPAGLVAYAAAALDQRIDSVVTQGTLGTYISNVPYKNQRLGTLVPGILDKVGDVAHLVALIAPRRALVLEPVRGDGRPMLRSELGTVFRLAVAIAKGLDTPPSLTWVASEDADRGMSALQEFLR